jgi:hypothetical protein
MMIYKYYWLSSIVCFGTVNLLMKMTLGPARVVTVLSVDNVIAAY